MYENSIFRLYFIYFYRQSHRKRSLLLFRITPNKYYTRYSNKMMKLAIDKILLLFACCRLPVAGAVAAKKKSLALCHHLITTAYTPMESHTGTFVCGCVCSFTTLIEVFHQQFLCLAGLPVRNQAICINFHLSIYYNLWNLNASHLFDKIRRER